MSVAKASYGWRQIPPAVVLYLGAIFALGFTYDGGIYAVLQNLYLLRLDYDAEFIGLFNSVGLSVFALLSLPIGAVRRWTSQQILLLGMALIAAGMLVVPLAGYASPSWQAHWLLAGRAVTMIGLACFFVHSPPFLMSITQGEWQSRALAWQAAIWSVSAFVGGLLGGYLPGWIALLLETDLSDPIPYQYPLFLATILMIPAFFAVARTPGKLAARSQDPSQLVPSAENQGSKWAGHLITFIVIIAAVRILQVAVPGALLTFANVYLDDNLHVPTNQIGIVSAIGRLVSVPVALLTPGWLAALGGFRLVIIISLVSVLAALPLALTDNWLLASFAFIMATGAAPLRYLSFLLFSLGVVTEAERSLVSGAGEMAIGMGFALMALAGGYIIVRNGYPTFFALSLILTLIGTGLFWLFFRSHRSVT